MQVNIEPLAPELEAGIRQKLAANPFIKFVGIQVPQLGQGYARFLLPFKPELANSIGLLQGGVIAALADEAVAFALYSLVPEGETFNTVEMKINFLGAVKDGRRDRRGPHRQTGPHHLPGGIRGAPGRPAGGQGPVHLYSPGREKIGVLRAPG